MEIRNNKKILIIGCIFAIFTLILSVMYYYKNTNINHEQNIDIEVNSNPNSRIESLKLAKEKNADTVAWLTVEGTDIDAQVMQAADNDYYLRRDEKKENDIWGCYFADLYANLSNGYSLVENTVLYGHTDTSQDKDGKRFSQLFRFEDLEFVKENRHIYLTAGERDMVFEIFAVFYTDIDFYYIDPMPLQDNFEEFISEVNLRNEFIFEGIEITDTDKLLTLSGCSSKYDSTNSGNHRFVVMARLVEDNSSDVIITKNENPKRPLIYQ